MATILHPAQKLINERGMVLFMPPNCMDADKVSLSEPDIYTQSSSQLYPLGSKLEFCDGRVFRYCKHGATSTAAPIARLVMNSNYCPGATGHADEDGFEGAPYANAAAAATTVQIADTASTKNEYEDAMLVVYPSGHYTSYRIAGNDASGGTYTELVLDDPSGLKTAITTSTGITVYLSRFSNCRTFGAEGTAGYQSAIGVSQASGFTSAYYSWLQTKGACIVTPTAYFGDSANERACFYNPSDGTIGTAASYDPSSGYQCIGYLLSHTISGYGDLWVMLMLE